ncbi:MAG: thiamine pyrophosphate-binding protein [Hyphomicrobiales bacterium]
MATRHGGQILIDQLKIQGVRRVFCVPGESYLAALDGLYDSGLDIIVCRQEGGAAIMAETQGKLTGQPGICFVTRGPGASNATAGVHIAYQDSTPMILFIGQVGRQMIDREAFQEMDYRVMFGGLAKWAAQIDEIERIPEYVSHAFHLATSGRPGPVVLALPEDMLSSRADIADVAKAVPIEAKAGAEDAATIAAELKNAKRPLVLVGGSGWSQQAANELCAFAEKFRLPVAASLRCQDFMDNRSSSYIGDAGLGINPDLAETIKDTDLLLVLGARLGEMTTSGYTLVDIPSPKQRLVHVYPGPDELGRVYRPDIAINASVPSLLAHLNELPAPNAVPWSERTEKARASYESWLQPQETPGAVKLEKVIEHVRNNTKDDAFIAVGAGNYTNFVQRYSSFRTFRTQLAPTSGSMGYSVPAAIAAKLEHPDRDVVCFAGDGCFMMHGQELATAVQYGANFVTIISNNGMYGTIRLHQERAYPGRVSGTMLQNPDFVALAEAYGAFGVRVEKTEEFPAVFEKALSAGKPAIIELMIDPDVLTPRVSMQSLRS